jgi:hypothetical protein
MTLGLATWSSRRVGALWGAGLLIEAALLGAMFALLVAPDPPLLARLRGEATAGPTSFSVGLGAPHDSSYQLGPGSEPPAAPEDSVYTVVRWPPGRPLLAGGGHVVALPARLWWAPALFVGAVPLLLVGVTGAWLWARRRAAGTAPGAQAAA